MTWHRINNAGSPPVEFSVDQLSFTTTGDQVQNVATSNVYFPLTLGRFRIVNNSGWKIFPLYIRATFTPVTITGGGSFSSPYTATTSKAGTIDPGTTPIAAGTNTDISQIWVQLYLALYPESSGVYSFNTTFTECGGLAVKTGQSPLSSVFSISDAMEQRLDVVRWYKSGINASFNYSGTYYINEPS